LRPSQTKHDRFFLTYRGGKCTQQPVGVNTIGGIPKKIATALGLSEPANYTGSSVAAWLSETVLRGRGPGASGFESHRRGRIFLEGRKLHRAMDVCVCLVGADGRVVEGRATLSRHHREVSRVQIPGRMASHGCCVL
jgi:hypothetical protein